MANEITSIIMVEKFWETVPRAWHRVREVIRDVASHKHQLTVEQFQVLRRIRRGMISVSAIADDSRISRSAVSKTVDILVKKGLITRCQDPDDRRNIPLELTVKGDHIMTSVYQEAEEWLMTRFERLTLKERQELADGLEQLANVFSRENETN